MKKSLVLLSKAVLFFFVFQTTAFAWDVQPNGAGFKASWGARDEIKLAKRPAPVTEQQIIPSKEGPRYLRIGGDPKDEHRQLGPNEQWAVSTTDLWVVTNGKSGKTYRGLVPVGTVFATAPTNDPTLRKAVWIKICGNDVLNPDNIAIFFRAPKDSSLGRQVQEAQVLQKVAQLPSSPPAVTAEPIATASKESWLSKNWPWLVGALAVIGGIVALSGGRGGGSSSPSSGPSPPPPGNN